jgi:hypothetical protein
MTKILLAGITMLLATGAANACDLEVKILKDNLLHVLEKCAGVETFHQDISIYHPRGGPHDAAHKCRLLSVEQADKSGAVIQTYCEFRIGAKQSGLSVQSTNNSILITNTENY